MTNEIVQEISSEYEFLSNKFKTLLNSANQNDEYSIIIDGRFYCRSVKTLEDSVVKYTGQKKVYVRYNVHAKNGQDPIQFYIKSSNSNSAYILDDCMTQILEKSRKNTLLNFQLDGVADVNQTDIRRCKELGIIIINTHAYRTGLYTATARDEHNKEFKVNLGSMSLKGEEVSSFLTEFKRYSVESYIDVVYNRTPNRFINMLYKQDKLTEVLKVYIPVFINYDKLYNPLMKDPTLLLKRNPVYAKALELNRLVTIGPENEPVLSCYLLTHKEICESLHMTKFARFTPLFIYKLMIGLLDPTIPGFPVMTNSIAIRPKSVSNGYPARMTLTELSRKISTINAHLQDATLGEETRESLQRELDVYSKYTSINLLKYHVQLEYDKLTSISTNYIDDRNKKKVDALYDIFSTARL